MLRFHPAAPLRLSVILSLLWAPLASAAPPGTSPADGLRDNTPAVYALTNARIVVAPGQVIEKGTIVLRDGVIVAVGAEVSVPADARLHDHAGHTLYAGFIDAYGETAVDAKTSSPHWNPHIRPQASVADGYQPDPAANLKLRSQGITARLVAPSTGVIRGTSALVTTSDESGRRAILKADVAQHLRLTVSRGMGRDVNPNSPMGAVALARQAFYDAQWHRSAWQAYAADRNLPRPERNDALSALQPDASGERLVIAETTNEAYFLRADQFAREFGLRLVVHGSGREYRRLDAIRQTGRAVIVPLNFAKAPNVASPEAALEASLEQLMHWDLAPENAGRLERAGVKIVFTSHGLSDPGAFLAAVRQAVERGLAPEAALRALTTAPAELLAASDRLGTLEAGKAANVVVADGDLFSKKTRVLETWVDGQRFEPARPPLFDLRGTWQTELAPPEGKPQPVQLRLGGKPGALSGTIILPADKSPADKPKDDKPAANADVKLGQLTLREAYLAATFPTKPFGLEGVAQLSVVVSVGETEASFLGHVVWPSGERSSLTAKRTAPYDESQDKPPAKKDGKPAAEGAKPDELKPEEKPEPEEDKPKANLPASFAVNYPLGEFGRSGPPEQSKLVLLKNAVVWTAAKEGTLAGASILIGEGKILAIGKDLQPPEGAAVLDLEGMHVSPGIIDCHSHMATDGGINESSQAISAEVRISDFLNADDIDIYRQLAGGVTSSNILHGSANPIGGQNQVIKLRWGVLGNELKFAEAPPGIKFALGENVKQANAGERFTTRYPQTRLGVEQLLRDEFQAARDYRARWQAWEREHAGLPPRRDLELDAIVEVLEGRRWVHCHSYRQDEILSTIRVLDDFGIRIGTFQHILEGYKVADAMAKHGAMASAFADWWAYKFEVYDAIPYAGALMHNAGVVVSFNSDDRELARHLNHEAAKATKYGRVPPAEALKFVTANPARQLRIDKFVGSLEPGKDADLAIWNGPPLAVLSRCEQTWIDGRKYFDRADDQARRADARQMRAVLVQKALAAGDAMRQPGEPDPDAGEEWPKEDLFCRHHGHDEG